jgi:toxin ParE1/3/4
MNGGLVRKRPLSRVDLIGCLAYLGERSPDAARRFRQAAEETFTSLAMQPGIGSPFEVADPRLAGLRCSRVRRFPKYLIFYLPIEGGIEVVRVLHGARDIRAILDEDAE